MYRISSAKIRSVVVITALILSASALFQISSYRNARRVEAIADQDAHGRAVLTALVALRTAVQDASIGRNRYLLTGNCSDFRSYLTAAAAVPELLRQVSTLTASDQGQADDARRLPSLVEGELQDLKLDPDACWQQSVVTAPHLSTWPDPSGTEQFRRVVDRMIALQHRVHAAGLAQTRSAASAEAHSLIMAAGYRVFVLLAGCTLILLQQARQRRTEQLCRQSEAFFRSAFDLVATGMALADQQGRWIKANRALCELLGHTEADLLRAAAGSITHPEDVAKARGAAAELRAGRLDRHQLEMRYIHKDGHIVWTVVTTSLVRDEQGHAQTLISQIQDVTERRRAEDQLRQLSLHDALTGLANRLVLNERLERGIGRANQDADFRLAVLFLDLDRFKLINDSLGHAAGDQLLITVAERLRRCVDSNDRVSGHGSVPAADNAGTPSARYTLVRLGGDEFTVVLEGFLISGDAERLAERILHELGKPVTLHAREVHAAASIGIVYTAAGRYATASQVLADADAALYKAKAAGRGRYAVFDADAQQSASKRRSLACDLRQAIERRQLVLHYRPVVSLMDRQVAGFEALIRWEHPEGALLAPEHFLELVEETGLSVQFSAWVLHQVCGQLGEWNPQRDRRYPLPPGATNASADVFIIVALSGKQLMDQDLRHRIRSLQEERPGALANGSLRVAIAETVLMQDTQAVQGPLAELKLAGVQIWMDNFGSGVTSLGCMRLALLDGVMMDGRIVGSTTGDRDGAAVAHSVLELARNLRLQVIATELETAEQIVMLQAMGCDLGRGSYFGPQLAASEAVKMLGAGSSTATALSA